MNPSYPGAPPPASGAPSSRFFDILETLRTEYAALEAENGRMLSVRNDYHRKVEEHLAELAQMESVRILHIFPASPPLAPLRRRCAAPRSPP